MQIKNYISYLENSLNLLVFPMPDPVSSFSPNHPHRLPPPVFKLTTLNLSSFGSPIPHLLLLLSLLPADRPPEDLLEVADLELSFLQLGFQLLDRFSLANLAPLLFHFAAPFDSG